MCFFHMGIFSLPTAGLFSCSWLRGTQGACPHTTAQVWGLAEVRGTCSGDSKSPKLATNHGEAFQARRAIQAHANPSGYKIVPQVSRAILLTARTDCLATSCSCSSARACAREHLVLVPSCSCSSTACSWPQARALVLEC